MAARRPGARRCPNTVLYRLFLLPRRLGSSLLRPAAIQTRSGGSQSRHRSCISEPAYSGRSEFGHAQRWRVESGIRTRHRTQLERRQSTEGAPHEEVSLKKMTANNRSRNRALVNSVVLPMLFLTVALLGGLRVGAESRTFIFFAPPLVALFLGILLMLLLVRGRLIRFHQWIGNEVPPLTNVVHVWMLITLFFASAQAFNSVLPERGLLHWLFSFFFLWTLWNNQFSSFDPPRLLRSLAI